MIEDMETRVDLEVQCPHCGERLSSTDKVMGRTVPCPACGKDITIPIVRSRAVESGVPAPVHSGSTPEKELDIFCIHPAMAGFLGELMLGILLSVVLVGVVLIVHVLIRSRSIQYRLTTQRLLVRRGLIARHTEELELYRVKDITVDQGVLQRLFGVGTVTVLSTDDSTPRIVLNGILEPEAVKDRIREQFRLSRQREKVRAGEFFQS